MNSMRVMTYHVHRCKGVEHFLLALLPGLPDMEIIINVMDYPLASRHFQPLPIFSFSKVY